MTPEQYASAHPVIHGPTCAVCALPPALLAEVRHARLVAGLTFNQLSGWLKEDREVRVSYASLKGHFALHEETR